MSQEKFQQAVNLFKTGNKKQAQELLLDVVDIDPANAEAWFGLALCTDDITQKRRFLEKVLEVNPQHQKASQLLEKIDSAKSVEPENAAGKQNFSVGNAISYVTIGILVLCVAWLFYKVNILEKSLLQTQAELNDTRVTLASTIDTLQKVNILEKFLLQTQAELNDTRVTLASTIDTLQYVKVLAENADRYAHSHYSDSRLKVNISPIKDPLQGILSLNGVTFYWNTSDYPELGLNNEP